MSKFPEQRVGMLVDLQNLYYSARVLHSKKVNFKNVLADVTAGRKMIRAVAYGISTAEGMEEKFFEFLETTGFEVKTKDLQVFPDGARKGDWDVGIAVDAIKMSKSLDVIILASGDGDYIPLVEYIRATSGCRVELVAFHESSSSKLLEVVDDFLDLSKEKRKYLI
ncbi:MAG: NYN domain-containing protein [Candidatus Moranbacteria bacterium]|nr:NYN domain-containing protein [Candidatus Moranbacteria bacterium]